MKLPVTELGKSRKRFFVPCEDGDRQFMNGKLNIWLYLEAGYCLSGKLQVVLAAFLRGDRETAISESRKSLKRNINAVSLVTGEKKYFPPEYKVLPRNDPV